MCDYDYTESDIMGVRDQRRAQPISERTLKELQRLRQEELDEQQRFAALWTN